MMAGLPVRRVVSVALAALLVSGVGWLALGSAGPRDEQDMASSVSAIRATRSMRAVYSGPNACSDPLSSPSPGRAVPGEPAARITSRPGDRVKGWL